MIYVYNPYLCEFYLYFVLALSQTLQSSHSDSSQKFSYDLIFILKKSDIFICFFPPYFWVSCYSIMLSITDWEIRCLVVIATIFLQAASVFFIYQLPLMIFDQKLSSSNYPCFLVRISPSLLDTTANPTKEKLISLSPHVFFRCSFKAVLRQCILFFKSYRKICETTILTSCKSFMIPSFPFSSFY